MTKYNKGARRQLTARVRAYYRDGLGYLEMLPKLITEGFTAPDGSELLYQHVRTTGNRVGLKMRGRSKRRTSAVPTVTPAAVGKLALAQSPTKDDTSAIADLVLDANLPADRKIALLLTLRGISGTSTD